jgi:hypothetical protein
MASFKVLLNTLSLVTLDAADEAILDIKNGEMILDINGGIIITDVSSTLGDVNWSIFAKDIKKLKLLTTGQRVINIKDKESGEFLLYTTDINNNKISAIRISIATVNLAPIDPIKMEVILDTIKLPKEMVKSLQAGKAMLESQSPNYNISLDSDLGKITSIKGGAFSYNVLQNEESRTLDIFNTFKIFAAVAGDEFTINFGKYQSTHYIVSVIFDGTHEIKYQAAIAKQFVGSGGSSEVDDMLSGLL